MVCHLFKPFIIQKFSSFYPINLSIYSITTIILGPKEKLNWDIRYKIAFGTAEGICYLHEGCQRRIIHKDIKAANILLTEDFQPQVPFLRSNG